MFFSCKNSAKIDAFCTLCEILTPNAETVEGGDKVVYKYDISDSFADTYSSQNYPAPIPGQVTYLSDFVNKMGVRYI